MEPPRQKRFARLILGGFAALCVVWLARLDYAQKISTDVLDLIPSAEQSPEAGIVRSLAGDAQAKVMLFALRDPRAPDVAPTEAARAFASILAADLTFAEAVPMGDDAAQNAMAREVFQRRFKLLFPSWLTARRNEYAKPGMLDESGWTASVAEQAAKNLEAFLAKPEAVAMQELVTADPLLLVPGLIERVGGLSAPSGAAGGHALVWGRIKASPLAEEGQKPVFAAIDRALAQVREKHPGVELQWSGVNRFAAASRARIEAELGLLNTISIVAVLGVGCLFIRRLWKILHLLPVILISLLGAWTAATLVFDRIHVLVFVIGSLLSGVAIDYGFYIYMQPALRPDEPYAEKLRRLLKPLLASCLTTVIGFSLLLFSDLPLLREVGLFVGAGLLCALGAAMLYFAQLERPFLETREFGTREHRPLPRGFVTLLFTGVLAIALIGPWRLLWRDDVRQLEIPSPELHANEEALRQLFGDNPDRRIFLVLGATIAEARENFDRIFVLPEKLNERPPAASLAFLFPTEAEWKMLPQWLGELAGFEAQFRAALVRHGFDPESFADFFSAWREFQAHPPRDDYESLYRDLGRQLTGPLALLYRTERPSPWFLVSADRATTAKFTSSRTLIAVDQLESLNSLFTRYRWSALKLSLIGLALVIGSVFAIYRGRGAIRIALIPAGACFFVFGIFGLLGHTLNLFHLLGAFLGVCLSHNYAIFSADTAEARKNPPTSIRLSALSTAASFGVLGFSRIPVIHALGMTVALIVVTALLVVEIEPFTRRRPAS
ncbi:MAG TPA: MMPL family transporter [Opitutaceae bacterium]|nr:MMPL family transporter [Opitutaceae bacterium]